MSNDSLDSPNSTAGFDCRRVALSLPAYLADELAPEERRLVRRHIHQCPTCFAKAVASDPAEIFAPLAEMGSHSRPDAKPDPFWDGFWPAIQEGIKREEQRGRFRFAARRALPLVRIPRRAAALFALAAAAAVLVFVMVGAPGRAPSPPAPLGPLVSTAPPAGEPGAPVGPGGTSGAAGQAEILREGRPLPPTVELVRTPDPANARIFSMTYYEEPAPGAPAGSSPKATELVLIVDAGIEL